MAPRIKLHNCKKREFLKRVSSDTEMKLLVSLDVDVELFTWTV